MSKTRHGVRLGLIGHRGYPQHYPENSISGLVAAIEAGGTGVEFDVQLTSDLVPVLLHDADLHRTSDKQGLVMDTPWSELQGLAIGESKRFGDLFFRDRLPTLKSAVNILAGMPPIRVFVEIKEESLQRFGIATVMDAVIPIVEPLGNSCILISFNQECLTYARNKGWPNAIGWVFDHWQADQQALAEALAPEYLFTDWRTIPESLQRLWSGPWQWVLYDVTTAEVALNWASRGASFVETWAMTELRKDLAKAAR